MRRAGSITRVISGGQTGVDRAALDAAMALGIACGGWCPRGRLAEDGRIPARYPLRETPQADYAQRTEWNVRDADGTLILVPGRPTGGTRLTWVLARRLGKPCLVVAPGGDGGPLRTAIDWAVAHGVNVLNVAGPRESGCPGIYRLAREFLRQLLTGGAHAKIVDLDGTAGTGGGRDRLRDAGERG